MFVSSLIMRINVTARKPTTGHESPITVQPAEIGGAILTGQYQEQKKEHYLFWKARFLQTYFPCRGFALELHKNCIALMLPRYSLVLCPFVRGDYLPLFLRVEVTLFLFLVVRTS